MRVLTPGRGELYTFIASLVPEVKVGCRAQHRFRFGVSAEGACPVLLSAGRAAERLGSKTACSPPALLRYRAFPCISAASALVDAVSRHGPSPGRIAQTSSPSQRQMWSSFVGSSGLRRLGPIPTLHKRHHFPIQPSHLDPIPIEHHATLYPPAER